MARIPDIKINVSVTSEADRLRAAMLAALAPDDSNLVRHARFELDRIGELGEGGSYGGMVGQAVLELIEVLAAQRHSGGSVAGVLGMFERLARFDVLSPITGHPSEWRENERSMLAADQPRQWQNTRKPSVFWREGDTTWHDIDEVENGQPMSPVTSEPEGR